MQYALISDFSFILNQGDKAVVKLQLARILLARPDVLLLDEPSNDLDIDTLEWLERFINTCGLPVLFISHDETLIEKTANTTGEVLPDLPAR